MFVTDATSGVQRGTDGGQTWQRFNSGLSTRAVQALAFSDDGIYLYAGLAVTMQQAGAFALPAASKDAVLVLNLTPGLYTAQVSGGGRATGSAIVEIYDLGK